MTTLTRPRVSLTRTQRRLSVVSLVALALLATLFLWLDLQAGLNGSVFSVPWMLCFLGAIGLHFVLWRRFRPLPDFDERTDERQEQRHLLAYKQAFRWQTGAVLLASQVYLLGHLRGWALPEHPLTPLLALIWVGVLALLPSLIFAWTEPDLPE